MVEEPSELTPEPQDATPGTPGPDETTPDVDVTPPTFMLVTNTGGETSKRSISGKTED